MKKRQKESAAVPEKPSNYPFFTPFENSHHQQSEHSCRCASTWRASNSFFCAYPFFSCNAAAFSLHPWSRATIDSSTRYICYYTIFSFKIGRGVFYAPDRGIVRTSPSKRTWSFCAKSLRLRLIFLTTGKPESYLIYRRRRSTPRRYLGCLWPVNRFSTATNFFRHESMKMTTQSGAWAG